MIGDVAASSAGLEARRQRLWELADERGIVAGIAIDHRDSLRLLLDQGGRGGESTAALRELKLRLVEGLASAATAIMLDEELGGLALDRGVVPASVGLIMPLEAQGGPAGDDPRTMLMTDFTATDAARRGAAACKVLVPYRADRAESASRQDAVIRIAAAACHGAGLPLVIEPVIGRGPGETIEAFAAAYPALVVQAVRRIRPLGVDLLKLPFPVLELETSGETAAMTACGLVDDACEGTPWVLLGGGVDNETFAAQVKIAGLAGASGFLVGRGIWGRALLADPGDVAREAAGPCRDELLRTRAEAAQFARPLPRAA